MRYLLIILFILKSTFLYSQVSGFENSPYNNAPEIVKKTNAFQREKWFYEQRMFPNNSIPKDAYKKAYEKRGQLRIENGFAMMSVFDTWTSIGPTPGFLFGSGNVSSRISTVKYDPVNPNHIYIGAAGGGVWKSTDAGATWISKSDYEMSLSSGSIAIDPNNPNIIYYGTGEATFSLSSYYGRGILKSTDGGSTWNNCSAGLPSSTFASRLVIRPNHSNELFVAQPYAGLYRSTNSGSNWTLLVSGRCDDVIFSPSGDTAYIIGNGTGYRISTDGGASFNINSSLTPKTRNHLSICKTSPNIIYCCMYSGTTLTITVFKSTNSGITFSPIAVGQDFNAVQGWYDLYIHVNPFDPNYAYLGSVDMWRTTNGGNNFINISYYGGPHSDQQNMDFHPTDPNQMLCVNDGGVYKSTNKGTNWLNLNTNQTLTQFYRITADPSNANYIFGGTQDNGTQYTSGSLNWTAAFGGDGGEICFHARNSSYIIGEYQNNVLMRSSNGGVNWISASTGLTGEAAWIGPIISHPDSSGIFYTARERVFKTTNWGANWFAISSGTSGVIREMAISKSSPNIIYLGGTNIYRSTNRGYTFSNTGALYSGIISSMNVHPDSPQVAIMTLTNNGSGIIYKTTNMGSNWTDITSNLTSLSPANDALIYYPGFATSIYYVATDVGVFVTNNYGQRWVELANGLPNTVAMHLDYHQATNKLRVGTHGRGAFEIQLPTNLVDIQTLSINESGNQIYSSQTITPSGYVRNNGSSNASFNVIRKINPGGYISERIINNLGGGSSVLVSFDPFTFISGTLYSVKDSVHINGDLNTLNDTLSSSFIPQIGNSIVYEDFSFTEYPPAGWNIEYTGTNYWSRSTLSSFGSGSGSAMFSFYNASAGTIQSMVLPQTIASVAGDSIKFDHAYATYETQLDQLQIETSTNAGISYSTLALLNGGVSGPLVTATPTTSYFTPLSNQWASKKYALPLNTNKIRFKSISGYGNNLYVDNIRMILNSSVAVDAQILSIGQTGEYFSPTSIIFPTGIVRNNSVTNVSFNVVRKINPGGYVSLKNISNLAGGASLNVTFEPWTFSQGITYSIKDSLYLIGDINKNNDTLTALITPFLGSYSENLAEGFLTSTYPPLGWSIEYTGTNYWTRSSSSSYGVGEGSSAYSFFAAPFGTVQYLVSPTFIPTILQDTLKFDHAYATYLDQIDQLQIETSTNSGSNYSTLILLNGGVSGPLVTASPTTSMFIPNSSQWATKKYVLPIGTNKIRFKAISSFGNFLYIDNILIKSIIAYTSYNVKLIPEGFYDNISNKTSMKDTIKINLRSIFSPFQLIDSAASVLDSLIFQGNFVFKNANTGTYYLQVIHRNSIETWSKSGGQAIVKGGNHSYDFTSSINQAYGNNMLLKGTKFCIYGGDINKSGSVNLTDIVGVYNDAASFATGYIQSDVTGDRITNLTDLILVYNNSSMFVNKITP